MQIDSTLTIFDEHRARLFSIAYRMLGSAADAEDMLQETFLRFQQSPEVDVESPRAYLVTILTRLCLNHLQSARVQREQYVGEWLPEPIVTDPRSDPFGLIHVDESLSMAFLVLLERLTPIERAVFLLREVFEYEYSEIAAMLGQSEVNCRQILRRARQHVSEMRPRFEVPEQKHDELLRVFLDAVDAGDPEGVVAFLSEDVVLHSDGGGKAAAAPNAVRGADKVARGMLGGIQRFVPAGLVRRLTWINGAPGIINYLDGKPHSVFVIEVAEGRIQALYIVTNPEKLSRLPDLG
ncbi:MAG TPA: RNA polymerase sigma-70 factor [Candidatus Acidoferrum sp.]|nr:RNA polymerase sigma-70 factor [Candidatus Acidoferrum sp.]